MEISIPLGPDQRKEPLSILHIPKTAPLPLLEHLCLLENSFTQRFENLSAKFNPLASSTPWHCIKSLSPHAKRCSLRTALSRTGSYLQVVTRGNIIKDMDSGVPLPDCVISRRCMNFSVPILFSAKWVIISILTSLDCENIK